jgi:hypothetical protein
MLEYDGTDFAGFQLQGKGERTVQGVLETTIAALSGEPCRVHGAGRTDAGVHATGQVAHFESRWRVPADKLVAALNRELPRDLAVRRADPGPGRFPRALFGDKPNVPVRGAEPACPVRAARTVRATRAARAGCRSDAGGGGRGWSAFTISLPLGGRTRRTEHGA